MNINGGQGADFISYTVNAPVRIDGGDGLDTLVVVGTEFGDDFVITDAGRLRRRPLRHLRRRSRSSSSTRRRATTASTSRARRENVVVEVYGGLGSDVFNVGGTNGQPITVVANSLQGHSGLIDMAALSADPRFAGVFVQDIVGQGRRQRRGGHRRRAPERPAPRVRAARPDSGLRQPRRRLVHGRPDARAGGERPGHGAPRPDQRTRPPRRRQGHRALRRHGPATPRRRARPASRCSSSRTNWFDPADDHGRRAAPTRSPRARGPDHPAPIVQGASPDDGGAYDNLEAPSTSVDRRSTTTRPTSSRSPVDPTTAARTTTARRRRGRRPPPPSSLPYNDAYEVLLTHAPTGRRSNRRHERRPDEDLGPTGRRVRQLDSTLDLRRRRPGARRRRVLRARDARRRAEGLHFSRITNALQTGERRRRSSG